MMRWKLKTIMLGLLLVLGCGGCEYFRPTTKPVEHYDDDRAPQGPDNW